VAPIALTAPLIVERNEVNTAVADATLQVSAAGW